LPRPVGLASLSPAAADAALQTNMSANLRFSYVVAVHNEEAVLEKTVQRLTQHLSAFPGSAVFLGENGSSDGSLALAQRLAGQHGQVTVHAFSVPLAGLGHALEEGVRLALLAGDRLTAEEKDQHVIVFTAADLPFGFTDLDGCVAARAAGFRGIVIGSKAHPDTRIQKTASRMVASAGYHALRLLLLRMKTRDPQGTFFIDHEAASKLVGKVQARNYFYTTELVFLAEQAGIPVREVPVAFEEERRPSTVRIWKHGSQMARQLWQLRSRAGR
jgi:glycosyltransferase involved in cell wall biosynthesis